MTFPTRVVALIILISVSGCSYEYTQSIVDLNSLTGTIDTSKWKTYRSNKYNFEIRFPESWVIMRENEQSITFSKNFRATYVAVYPLGPPININADSRPCEISFDDSVHIKNAIDFLLDDEPYNTLVTFNSPPDHWQPEGYIWGGVEIMATSWECFRDEFEKEHIDGDAFCDPIKNYQVGHGTVNYKDRKVVEHILASFRFLD